MVYCTGCKWMLRAAWAAQELLSTFEADIGAVRSTGRKAYAGEGGGKAAAAVVV